MISRYPSHSLHTKLKWEAISFPSRKLQFVSPLIPNTQYYLRNYHASKMAIMDISNSSYDQLFLLRSEDSLVGLQCLSDLLDTKLHPLAK